MGGLPATATMPQMLDAPTNAPVELADYIAIFRRRLWVIIVVTLVVVGAALGWSLTRNDSYTAQGQIVIGSDSKKDPDVPTQVQLIGSEAVHLLALQKLPGAARVSAHQPSDSNGVIINASSRNAAAAADSVNAHVDAYLQYLRDQAQRRYDALKADLDPQISALQQRIDAFDVQLVFASEAASSSLKSKRDGFSGRLGALVSELEAARLDVALAGLNVDIAQRATPPISTSSPDPGRTALVALGAGLLLGVLLALLLEFMDDTIRTRQDLLRAAGGELPTLAVVPATRSRANAIVSLTDPDSPAAESYRSLRTAMNFAGNHSSRCIEVASLRTRHGKTETLVNLAVLAAQAGQRVVVVDCDLRAPRVHEFFGLPNDVGFTSVVYGEPVYEALQRVPGVDRLFVLTSGPLPLNPSEVLASERCEEVLTSLQADNTLVLVDTPPLLLVTDAVALAPSTGAVLLVATAGVARRKQLRQALDRLQQIGARILGMVLYRAASADTAGFGQDVGRRERKEARRRQPVPVGDSPGGAEEPEASMPNVTDTA